MRMRWLAFCCLLGASLLTGAVMASPLSAGAFLWRDPGDLQQLEDSWLILQGPGPDNEMAVPVTSAGPVGIRLGRPDSPASSATTVADYRPWFRFDLCAASLWQGGQANGPFYDELAYTPGELANPDQRLRMSAGFLARLSPGWTLWQRTLVDSDPALDPASRTKEFHQINASVEVPDAVLAYERDGLAAWAGRRWEGWGPGWTGSLILEPGGPPPDGFGYSWTRDRWSARYRCVRLDDVRPDDQPFPRYLAGHRLDLAITPSLRIGLAETALVISPGGVPFWLLNPLLPWSLSQSEDRDPEEGTNILWSLDSIWNPSPDWALYGQFLLDDFMIDNEDRDTHPDQLGCLAGLLWSGTRPKAGPASWRAGLEYSRLGSWTYVHRDPALRYRAWSAALGHPAGPDSESLTLFCSRSGFGPSASGSSGSGLIWARWHRQGQVWLDTPLGPVGSAGLPWPTQPVSRWWQLGAALRLNPFSTLTGTLRGGWTGASPGIPADGLQPNPSSIETGRGFWASFTLTVPLLRIDADL